MAISPRAFLDAFGRGIKRADGDKIPFGSQGGGAVNWTKAPIGYMFDLLQLDKPGRDRLWGIIGKPDTSFHKTKKDDTWDPMWAPDGSRMPPSPAHKTPHELFVILCDMGRMDSGSLVDAIALVEAVAVAFEVTSCSRGVCDGECSYQTAYSSVGWQCERCHADYLARPTGAPPVTGTDRLIAHVLFGH